MGVAVERQRHGQDVPEILVHGLDAMAVREAFGLQGDRDVADDAADADRDPDAQQHRRLMPHGVPRKLVAARQQDDDPAEQHRIEKLQAGHHEVGEGQEPGNADVAAQQAEHPAIHFEKSHVWSPWEGVLSSPSSTPRMTARCGIK